ncbi:hypothetical protein PRIPAC_83168 [Pristionchus pacificus]|uniref:Uncharacterized protein n=1 Tax=Pristionchus pacificus TaxID=54126 RepID=A0A2A6BNR5_PRIPA|nr:hypothetical protein PRIPAC_83168 [Pristionchus pacificus]|eukprot:PDM67544.1 hypothetical protein PRIPAC_48961 [Pristionchus pacificus]
MTPLVAGGVLSFTQIGSGMVGAVFALAYPIFFMRDWAIPVEQRGARIQNAVVGAVCTIMGIVAVNCAMLPLMGSNVAFVILIAAQAGVDSIFLPKFMEISDPSINDEARLVKADEFKWCYMTCVFGGAALGWLMAYFGYGHTVVALTMAGCITLVFYVPQLLEFAVDGQTRRISPENAPDSIAMGVAVFSGLMSVSMEPNTLEIVTACIAIVRFAIWSPMNLICLVQTWARIRNLFTQRWSGTAAPLVVGAAIAHWQVGYGVVGFALAVAYPTLFIRDLEIASNQGWDRNDQEGKGRTTFFSLNFVRKEMKRACAEAGVTPFTPHCLRGGGATTSIEEGTPVEQSTSMKFGESILFALCAVTPLLVGLFLGITNIGFAIVSAVFAVAYPIFFMRDLAIPSDQRGDRIQSAVVVAVCGIVGIFAVQCAMVPVMGYQVAFLVMMAAQSGADYFFISNFVEFSNCHLNNQDRLSKIATHQNEYWQFVCGLSGYSLLLVVTGAARRVERSSSLLLSSSFSLPMTGGERIKFRLLFLSIKIRARILIDEREFVIFWRRMKRKGGGNRNFDYKYVAKDIVDLHDANENLLIFATRIDEIIFPNERHLRLEMRDPRKVKWLYETVLGMAVFGVVYMAFWVLHLFKADPVSPDYRPLIARSFNAAGGAGFFAIGLTLMMTTEMLMPGCCRSCRHLDRYDHRMSSQNLDQNQLKLLITVAVILVTSTSMEWLQLASYALAPLAGAAIGYWHTGFELVGCVFAVAYPIFFMRDLAIPSDQRGDRIWNAIKIVLEAVAVIYVIHFAIPPLIHDHSALRTLLIAAQAGADFYFIEDFVRIIDPSITDHQRRVIIAKHEREFPRGVAIFVFFGCLTEVIENGQAVVALTEFGLIYMAYWMFDLFQNHNFHFLTEEASINAADVGGLCGFVLTYLWPKEMLGKFVFVVTAIRCVLWLVMIVRCLTFAPLLAGAAIGHLHTGFEVVGCFLAMAYPVLFSCDLMIPSDQRADRAKSAFWIAVGTVVLIYVTRFTIAPAIDDELATLIMISARSGADFFFLPDFMKISDDRVPSNLRNKYTATLCVHAFVVVVFVVFAVSVSLCLAAYLTTAGAMQACLVSFAGIVMTAWLPQLVPRIRWVPVVRMHGSMGAVNPGQDDDDDDDTPNYKELEQYALGVAAKTAVGAAALEAVTMVVFGVSIGMLVTAARTVVWVPMIVLKMCVSNEFIGRSLHVSRLRNRAMQQTEEECPVCPDCWFHRRNLFWLKEESLYLYEGVVDCLMVAGIPRELVREMHEPTLERRWYETQAAIRLCRLEARLRPMHRDFIAHLNVILRRVEHTLDLCRPGIAA